MPSYIFLTHEGFTYSPDPCAISPDVVNMQVLGFAAGGSHEEAFENLIIEDPELLETAFDETQCIELKHDSYEDRARWFYLSDARDRRNAGGAGIVAGCQEQNIIHG